MPTWRWLHWPQFCEGSRGAILGRMRTRPGTCRGGAFACWHLAWPSCPKQAVARRTTAAPTGSPPLPGHDQLAGRQLAEELQCQGSLVDLSAGLALLNLHGRGSKGWFHSRHQRPFWPAGEQPLIRSTFMLDSGWPP
jgi:hypothetical protein